MMLKSIQLENIRSYLDEKVEFPLGSTLLSGDVGSGKSTILLAMDFALFGLRRGELEGTDLLRHGKARGSVELVFEIDGTEYKISRTLKRSKDSVVQDTGAISINGREQEMMPIELKSRIFELFGYPQEKKNRPLFRYTVYTPQERMKDILFDETERLATLRKIFSVDKYGQIKTNTKLVITELRSLKREHEAFSRDLEQKIAEKEEKEAERQKVLVEIDRYATEISALDALLTEKEENFELLKSKISELNSIRKELSRTESEVTAKSKRLPVIESELRDIDSKMSKLTVTEVQDTKLLREEISDLENKKERMISEYALISGDLTNLESVLKSGVCSFCGQTVKSGDFHKHLAEKTRIREELKKNMDFSAVSIAKLKERLTTAERAESDKRLISEYENRKNRLEDEKKLLLSELERLSADLEPLREKLKDEKRMEDLYSSLHIEISRITTSKIAAEKSRSRHEQQLYDIDHFLKTAEKEISEKRAAREKIARINSLVSWFESCFVPLMDIIEKHVMTALQQAFNEMFQKWFDVLMGEQFSVRISENFSPVIEQNGYLTEYSNLSGGEKTAVALAYRLALNKVINAMIDTIKTKDVLILDEPTDGFSADQLDRIRDVIAELQLNQVILVSHEPKIDTFVDNVIRVYKEEHISRVEN